jgi:hypothetical protein
MNQVKILILISNFYKEFNLQLVGQIGLGIHYMQYV